jgi:RNA polymerase sigma-70 factor, ECF subfamily
VRTRQQYASVVEDEALLRALQDGDESAFRALVARYHTSLVRVARYHVDSDAAAEDVAQDTWIAVMKGVHRFEHRSSFKTWLFKILVNRARTAGSRDRRQVPIDPMSNQQTVPASRFDAGGAWSDPPTPFTELVDGQIDREEVAKALHAAVRDLPEPHQAVVTLRDVQGLSTYEVSALLGLTEGNVRVILHRGRAKVRAAIEDLVRGGWR